MWEIFRGKNNLLENSAGLAKDYGFKRLPMNALSSLIFCPLFFHWLPVPWRIYMARWATLWGWLEKPSPQRVREMVEEIRLQKKNEFQELFPDCQILTEKMLGILPKSYIAVRKA